MNKQKFTKLMKDAIAKNVPIPKSEAVGIAKYIDRHGTLQYSLEFDDGDVTRWEVTSGRQLKLKMLQLMNVYAKVLTKAFPHECSFLNTSVGGMIRIIKNLPYDKEYSDQDKIIFNEDIEHINLALEAVLMERSKVTTAIKSKIKLLKRLLLNISSSNITLEKLYRHPTTPANKTLMGTFRYIDDAKEDDDEPQEIDGATDVTKELKD